MINIVLAEDQTLLLGAMKTLLGLEVDMEVVATAASGLEAFDLVVQHRPHVLVTDIEMPGLDGLDLAKRVVEVVPQTRVLMVTTFDHAGYFQRAMDAGVAGYILKDSPIDELIDAVREIARGGSAIDTAVAASNAAVNVPHLSVREREVLLLAAHGKSNKIIARELGISPGTARNYLAGAAAKLGAANRFEASQKARSLGLI